MSNEILKAHIDIEPVQEALAGTSKSLKAIQKQTLRIVAKATARQVRAAITTSDLERRTGELSKAYTYKLSKSGTEANIYPRALSGGNSIFPKAMTLSYGHEGPTERASSWHIAPRGFVQSGQKYAESGGYMTEVQKMIDKEIEKYWS